MRNKICFIAVCTPTFLVGLPWNNCAALYPQATDLWSDLFHFLFCFVVYISDSMHNMISTLTKWVVHKMSCDFK